MTAVRFPQSGWLASAIGRQISRLTAQSPTPEGNSLRERIEALKAKYAKDKP